MLLYSCRFSRLMTTGGELRLLATLGGQEVLLDPGDDPVPFFERRLGLV